MSADASTPDRKLRGAFYTPPSLVDTIVEAVITPEFVAGVGGRPVDVLDPACGDARFLRVAADRIIALGGRVRLTGVEIDAAAADAASAVLAATRSSGPGSTGAAGDAGTAEAGIAPGVVEAAVVTGDALRHDWGDRRFDLVIGNPPFLSQLSAATTRGGRSERGGGPYADVAAEFLDLGSQLARPSGGRLALVLPQSMLSARDAEPIRRRIDRRASMVWSWWSRRRVFDAEVNVCVVAFEFGARHEHDATGPATWGRVVTDALGIPDLPPLHTDGLLGDRARLNANFRDEYYGMIPAVGEHDAGPELVTTGLIDPGANHWGRRPVRLAGATLLRPRVDPELLDARMRDWASKRLVPKVLVANQTRIIEAVGDPAGEWLPGVPVVAVYPAAVHWDTVDTGQRVDRAAAAAAAWEVAAVLTSPVASAWSWHRQAGTGLSADAIRVSPTVLAELPWPSGDLSAAVGALRAGDVRACGTAVDRAYGVETSAAVDLERWWCSEVDRIDRRADRSRSAATSPTA